ncbi:hypothetical protein HUK65_13690 [Rhodobacteraceae bacterium 2376]|uniref:Uncharacterized protein n=1 Tax=Rhabdonatronobacter sediminivivens TaxID=2743469 RepID=A0A7Z0I1V8_9RHOB|nr:hypothetical protein [Rhabdonatronobacter sediminivivens]NYS26042.1 hypothetical protein [Rhabdonatronobacter sediminivivens]
MASLLLVTCGDSDLQIVLPGDAETSRLIRMGSDTQRAIHERLLSGDLRYEMRPDAADLPRLGGSKLWDKEGSLAVGDAPETAVPHELCDATLPLVPVKLAGLDRLFQPGTEGKTPPPDTIVVFNTKRSHRADEPIATGRILAAWLADLFELRLVEGPGEVGCGTVCAVDYIDDTVPADGKRGRAVNPAAVQRIDDVLARISSEAASNVVFALSGGIPVYRDQIRACARFRFASARFFDCVRIDDPEHGLLTSHAPTFLPSDSFHARGEVRRLVQKGDFHGASVLAGQFIKQPDEKRWAVATRKIFRFLDGQLRSKATVPGLTGGVDNAQTPRCLLAAFRAEAALRSERFLEAVLWTSTFPDAAYIDLLERLEFVESVDEVQRRIFPKPGKGFPAGLVGGKGSGLPIERNGRNYLYRNSYPEREVFYRFFPEDAERGLRGYHEAMGAEASGSPSGAQQTDGPGIRLRQIRNVISHGALPAEAASWVVKSFRGAGLWSDESPFLLENLHVHDLIGSLTGCDPAEIYEDLVAGICAQLDNHRYEKEQP